MVIAIHSHFFYPSVGGCETFADMLATGLAKRGHAVRVITETPLQGSEELDRPYVIIRSRRWADTEALAGARVLVASGPSIRLLSSAWLQKIPFILVHQGPHGVCPVAIGWRHGRPCSVGVHCLNCDVGGQHGALENVKLLGRHAGLRWAMGQASANVFVSRALRQRVPAPRAQVIWNGFDAIFRPGPDLPREQERTFLFVGRLVSVKGAETALRGFAMARNQGLQARLRVIGDGEERDRLCNLASGLGLAPDVEFLPFQTLQQLAEQYRRGWALLFPSQWEEPFGFIVAEAMACGCPVIGSAHGAVPELVGETGMLVPATDIGKWSAAILDMAPAQRRHELAGAAATRAQEMLSSPASLKQYDHLVRRVAEANHLA